MKAPKCTICGSDTIYDITMLIETGRKLYLSSDNDYEPPTVTHPVFSYIVAFCTNPECKHHNFAVSGIGENTHRVRSDDAIRIRVSMNPKTGEITRVIGNTHAGGDTDGQS